MSVDDLRRARPSLAPRRSCARSALFRAEFLARGRIWFLGWPDRSQGGRVGVDLPLIAAASTRWSWTRSLPLLSFSSRTSLWAGPVALPSTMRWGVVPTTDTLLTLVRGAVSSWKDLLTLTRRLSPPTMRAAGPVDLRILLLR